MVAGKISFQSDFKWYLGPTELEIVDYIDVLGVQYRSDGKECNHVDNRITSAHRAMYGLSSVGMSYPGLASDVKAHLWKSVGVPCLTYGLNIMDIGHSSMQKLESAQGSIIKKCFGLGVRSHHSKLLQAMNIPAVKNMIKADTASLLHRVFRVESPYRKLCSFFLGRYISEGVTTPRTLIHRVTILGDSPVYIAFHKPTRGIPIGCTDDGVIDSLRYLVTHENYVKPWTIQHNLVRLLTSCF